MRAGEGAKMKGNFKMAELYQKRTPNKIKKLRSGSSMHFITGFLAKAKSSILTDPPCH